MDKVIICQPIGGKYASEIVECQKKAQRELLEIGYEPVSVNIEDQDGPLHYLGESIKQMNECSVAFFLKGWGKSAICQIENEVAELYGIKRIYERE